MVLNELKNILLPLFDLFAILLIFVLSKQTGYVMKKIVLSLLTTLAFFAPPIAADANEPLEELVMQQSINQWF